MYFEFPVKKIVFDFNFSGDCKIELLVNGRQVNGYTIHEHFLKKHNTIEIKFNKKDPTDASAFATLKKFTVNDGDFTDYFKTLPYSVDNDKHPDADSEISNNLYFGYVGVMSVVIEQTRNLLQQASWLIADDNFENIKWPNRNEYFRKKTFENVYEDSKFMFTGCTPPRIKEIEQFIDEQKLGNLISPLDLKDARTKVENWINASKRVNLQNFSELEHFSVCTGVRESLYSFLTNYGKVGLPKKLYHFNRQILSDKNVQIIDLFPEEPEEGSRVLLELPTPWYDDHLVVDMLEKAKNKNCYIAIDLTWLPMCMDKIDIDLTGVDEVYFSMNKCWPIHSLRPAMRWSKSKINDTQTFDSDRIEYPKIPFHVLMKLIEKFKFDYAFEKYVKNQKELCNVFELEPTSILWFTKNKNTKQDQKIMEPHFFLSDFVCVTKLLEHSGRYFW